MVLVDGIDSIRHERLRSLYVYWRAKQRPGRLPARQNLDVLEMKEWLGHLLLLDVEGNGSDFRYRLYGVTLVEYFGTDRTGSRVSDLDSPARHIVHDEYSTVVKTGRPFVVERSRTVRRRHQLVVKLLLPLAGDGHTVDMILSGLYRLQE